MSNTITNVELAELLRDVAAAYKIKDDSANRFKIIAYERAADAIEHLSSEAKDIYDEGKLEDIPGVGPSIAEHLTELFKTGHSKHFDFLMKDLPKSIFDLMKVPGIGPKTSYKLVKILKISDKDPKKALLDAARMGKIENLEGFGRESQDKIIKTLSQYKENPKRHLLPYADLKAKEIIDWMLMKSFVKRADPLGSLRRRASTIGDIDISIATYQAKKAIEHFVSYPKANRVLEKGDATASIVLPGNVQVDLLVQTPDSYGAALQHFTGSKHHNIALRDYALKKGMSLSEKGIKVLRSKDQELSKFDTEEKFYNYLDMDWIPPELREDSGELKAAVDHKLPHLIQIGDTKADFHIHSNFDVETSHDLGESSMQELVKKAIELNYDHIALTEHNPSKSKHSAQKILDILKRKREAVEKLNYSIARTIKKRAFKVFNSLEIDILPDGSLPVPPEGLKTLDFALVSIHSTFDLPKAIQTERVLKAFNNPKVKIFAHPTARKLNERESMELDWPKIFEACKKLDIWIEINADPARLDLPDFLVKQALILGLKLTMGTDSHHKDGMHNMPYAVSVARRGWAEKKNIVNTLNLHDFSKVLK